MDNFLKSTGAIVIGIAIAIGVAYPPIIIGIIVGWFYINEKLSEENEEDETESEEKHVCSKADYEEFQRIMKELQKG